jgi:thiol-disulfide isomerase/thioredoxin
MHGIRSDAGLAEFLAASKPGTAVVEFGTAWCQKCHEMFPQFYALSKKVGRVLLLCGVAWCSERRGSVWRVGAGCADNVRSRHCTHPVQLRPSLGGGAPSARQNTPPPRARPHHTPHHTHTQYQQHRYGVAQVEGMAGAVRAISFTPTFHIYRNGKVVDEVIGKEPQRLEDHLWLHSD